MHTKFDIYVFVTVMVNHMVIFSTGLYYDPIYFMYKQYCSVYHPHVILLDFFLRFQCYCKFMLIDCYWLSNLLYYIVYNFML